VEDGIAIADVEVAGVLEAVECNAAEVDVGFVEAVDVNAEVDLVAAEDLDAMSVVEDALSVVLGLLEVFAATGLLLLSSPQVPVSQGLVEQHPEYGPLAQR